MVHKNGGSCGSVVTNRTFAHVSRACETLVSARSHVHYFCLSSLVNSVSDFLFKQGCRLKRTSYVKVSRLLSCGYVHDLISHEKEMFTHERLGEEVRNVVRRWDERDAQLAVLNALTNEVVPALNVFRLRMVLRIVS